MISEKVLAEGTRTTNLCYPLIKWTMGEDINQRVDAIKQIHPGATIKLIAYIESEPRIIRPDFSVWVPHKQYGNVNALLVPGVGIVAENHCCGKWKIFPHGRGLKGTGGVLACELCLAKEKLYGFRLGGQ